MKKAILAFSYVLLCTIVSAQNAKWGNGLVMFPNGFSYAEEFDGELYFIGNYNYKTSEIAESYKFKSLDEVTPVPHSKLPKTEMPRYRIKEMDKVIRVFQGDKLLFAAENPKRINTTWVSIALVDSYFKLKFANDYTIQYDILTNDQFDFPGIQKSNTYWHANYAHYMMKEISVIMSPDESKTVFVYRKPPISKIDSQNRDTYVVISFDNEGDKLAEFEYTMPVNENKIGLYDFGITNSGQLFYLALKHNETDDKSDTPGYKTSVTLLSSNGVEQREIEFSMQDKWIRSTSLLLEDDLLTINGLYANDKKTAGIMVNGGYAVTVNLSSGATSSAFNEFPEHSIYTYEKNKKSFFFINYAHRITKVKMEEDGICYLLSLNYDISSEKKIKHSAQSFILLKIDYAGNFIFSHRINRKFVDEGKQVRYNVYVSKFQNAYYMFYVTGKQQVDWDIHTPIKKSARIAGEGYTLVCTKVIPGSGGKTEPLAKKFSNNQVPKLSSFYNDGKGNVYMFLGNKRDESRISLKPVVFPTKLKLGIYTM